MQAVCQLDDHHADVFGHGQKHLAQIQSLLLVHGVDIDVGEFGHTVHQICHSLAKKLDELLLGSRSVFHRIVEQRGRDHIRIHAQVVSEDKRHLYRMIDVGLAAAALLL